MNRWIAVAALLLAMGRMPALGEEGGKEPAPPSEAEEREILDFVRENNAEMGKHLGDAKEHNPEMFHQKMQELSNMYRNPDMRTIFSRTMKAETNVRRLSEAYRKASAKEKEGMRAELEQALNEQFDAKLAGHEMHLKKMQEEIARQKERVSKRKAMKEQIVKKRMSELSGDVESWDW